MHTFTRGLVAAACLLTAPAIADAPPVHAAASFAAPVNRLRFFGETNGGDSSHQVYSRTEAVALARRYDTIIGLRWTFAEHAAAMRAANPRLRLIAYMNGAMSKPGDRASMPESWFMHDANGNRVRNLYFDLHYMDVGNSGWRNWVAQRCADWIRMSGFDGCWLDDLGAGNLGTNLSAWPIDPRTGQRVTESNWLGYGRGELGVVSAANPGAIISSNGLNNGSNYFANNAARLLETSLASTAEGFLRGSRTSATTFRSVDKWKQDIDMLVDAGSRGKTVLAAVKLWASETVAQQNQWREYAYASFLLGTNGYQFLYFSVRGPGKPDASHPMDSYNLGTPSEAYTLRGGVYQRRFSAGLAMVNPGSTSKTVTLGGSYRLSDGQVVTQLTMPPYTGRLLRTP
ncbi:MAG: hypothetical protein H0U21_01835 [Acidimicrobiia bacterium]|nr:hypothetical protein [Acidimicrobiia bacterium]